MTAASANGRTYFTATRSATYSFLVSLPLLAAYELLIAFVNRGSLQQIRVGAEVWIKELLAVVGGTGIPVLAIGVVVVGVIVMIAERKRRPRIRPVFFLWTLAESAAYAVALAFLVSAAVGAVFAIAAQSTVSSQPIMTQFALSLGAGLYEELVFRVLIVGGLFWIFKRLLVGRTAGTNQKGRLVGAYVIAALLGAAAFSAVHYVGALGDPFTLPSFTFRFFFGLALNVVFLLRGFGVAAWSHALYDVLLVTGILG